MKEQRFFTAEMGLRLKKLRVEARLTQDAVADRMGLTGKYRKMTVWKLEHGHIGNPSLSLMARFLRACGARWNKFADLL